jgi:hypothetical protein
MASRRRTGYERKHHNYQKHWRYFNMKRKIVLIFMFLVFSVSLNAQTNETLQSLQFRYIEHLRSLGIVGTIYDSDVVFNILDAIFQIRIDPQFPNAFFLILPGIIKLETEEIRTKVALIALDLSQYSQGCEIFIHNGNSVGIRVVQYYQSPDDFKFHFMDFVRLLLYIHSEFLRHYRM